MFRIVLGTVRIFTYGKDRFGLDQFGIYGLILVWLVLFVNTRVLLVLFANTRLRIQIPSGIFGRWRAITLQLHPPPFMHLMTFIILNLYSICYINALLPRIS